MIALKSRASGGFWRGGRGNSSPSPETPILPQGKGRAAVSKFDTQPLPSSTHQRALSCHSNRGLCQSTQTGMSASPSMSSWEGEEGGAGVGRLDHSRALSVLPSGLSWSLSKSPPLPLLPTPPSEPPPLCSFFCGGRRREGWPHLCIPSRPTNWVMRTKGQGLSEGSRLSRLL